MAFLFDYIENSFPMSSFSSYLILWVEPSQFCIYCKSSFRVAANASKTLLMQPIKNRLQRMQLKKLK